MPKTLADMNPAEREQCVGMWCDYVDFREEPGRGIISSTTQHHRGPGLPVGVRVTIYIPGHHHGFSEEVTLRDITPRSDLPRAWASDGNPIAGEWEEGSIYVNYDCEPGECAVTIEGQTTGELSSPENLLSEVDVPLDKYGEGYGCARRFITDWESTNE